MDSLSSLPPQSKAVIQGHTMPHAAKLSPPLQQQSPRPSELYCKLRDIILNVRSELSELAILGHLDAELYVPVPEDVDTHALAQNPSEGFPIGEFPDPTKLSFWRRKLSELSLKTFQLEYGVEQPPPVLRRTTSAIFNVWRLFGDLASLGRPGHWILHHEDLYWPAIDTRPRNRKPSEGIAIRDINYKGVSLRKHHRDLVWDGKDQPPNFEDPEYWESKFTPEELRTLESLERQEGHSFHMRLTIYKRRLQDKKDRVFVALRQLALLGRPGHWILHHEEFYDPDIDTRPQTRKPDEEIYIRGLRHMGNPIPNKLIWAGKGEPPDFEDLIYWECKVDELLAKVQEVKDGKVQAQFTAEEVSLLESMEHQEDHFFWEAEKKRREAEEKEEEKRRSEEEITPSSRAAAERLRDARRWVFSQLEELRLRESEQESYEWRSPTQKLAERVNDWFGRESDPQARPGGLESPPVPQTTDTAPTDVSSNSWPAAKSLSRSAFDTSRHSGAASSAAAANASSEPRHSGTAGGPRNRSQRKRPADNAERLSTLRSAKRS
ncbi:hypothetical protein QBC37DRAFT_374946 [Rhypophila decipiens]|uniref:Uncharacterized protein n=1 Tax=Rhypophila decipiens TaxID=261697 RepID=A0AAN6Y4J7_9PEZI|nr:hypothetical protein QBC37DRAFT_374946 [Rhypophila decipiens]